MGSVQTTMRTYAMIDGVPYALAQGQDLAELKRTFEAAMKSGGAFVDFTAEGDRKISALVSAATRVVFAVATVEHDERDAGVPDFPNGDPYEFWDAT
ncbi:hypothetical protein [Microbacterium aurantiacum]|uniref:hypothetical protein n=1 Tax=Microbacterium aurantiacum TaxID=162393 RepID=UPI001FEBB1EE|nr:hypothetical protein [Microbacterium aurantiacum]